MAVTIRSRDDAAKLGGLMIQAWDEHMIAPTETDEPFGRGPWTVRIDGFHAPSINALLTGHWSKRARLKKAAMNVIQGAFRAAVVPLAVGKRRVEITLYRNKGRPPDPDNHMKVILDGIKHYGAIIDDSQKWCECPTPKIVTGPKATVIVVSNVEGAA